MTTQARSIILRQPRTTLEAIRLEKLRVQRQLLRSRTFMKTSVQNLYSPAEKKASRWGFASSIFKNAPLIIRGIQFGASAVAAYRSLFAKRGRR